MRDSVLTLAQLQSAGLEGRDAGLSSSDRDRTAARTCATPRLHEVASQALAIRRGHRKRTLPGPVASGRSGSPS